MGINIHLGEKSVNHKKLFNYAIFTGEIMLRNGAETSRVEDTINRILRTSNFTTIESFVTPTGIFATLDDVTIDMITYVKRVHKRDVHLSRVSLANDISRKYCEGDLSLDEAMEKLYKVIDEPPYNHRIMTLAKGIASGCFTVVFGGLLEDMITAFVIGIIVSLVLIFLERYEMPKFMSDIVAGSLIACIGIVFYYYLNIGSNFDLIIVGGIMPLVPGVAITNAIRDTMQGDLLSGISRTVDAFIVATSIAVGVGIILKLFDVFIGGNLI